MQSHELQIQARVSGTLPKRPKQPTSQHNCASVCGNSYNLTSGQWHQMWNSYGSHRFPYRRGSKPPQQPPRGEKSPPQTTPGQERTRPQQPPRGEKSQTQTTPGQEQTRPQEPPQQQSHPPRTQPQVKGQGRQGPAWRKYTANVARYRANLRAWCRRYHYSLAAALLCRT